MTSSIANGIVGPGGVVETVRNMSMGPRTPMPWPMWPAKVSHRMPVEW